jgi:DNA polymerase III subunit delta
MPRILAAALWKRLAQGQIDPCYLFFGEETYLIQESTTTLIEHILGTAPRDFNCDVFGVDNDTLEDALSIARTLPMMATHRVVVLHGFHQLRKADWPQLERYLEQPSTSTALICTGSISDPKKYPPCLWQHAVTVEYSRLEGSRLHDWVTHTVAQRGYRIAPEALQVLLYEQQPDLQTIRQEIEKLCTYVGETSEITLDDVQEVTHTSRLQSIFALSDALGTRQIGPAFIVVERLLNQGEPPLVILSMMVRHVRLLWSVKQLEQQRLSASHMAKTLGLPLAVCRQLVTQSRHFSLAHLRQLYTAALEADLTFKTSNKPPRAILEELILHVCGRGTKLV